MTIRNSILACILATLLLTVVANGWPFLMRMKPFSEPRDLPTVVIKNDTVYSDTLKLSLRKIPDVQSLHTVAKSVMGKWARLFTVIKIEESGFDGTRSAYALKYNNLTGMRYPSRRETTAKRMGYSFYSVYENWFDCMADFKIYVDYAERAFIQRYQRPPKNEKEMVRQMYGSYNPYSKWLRDVFWLIDNFDYQ